MGIEKRSKWWTRPLGYIVWFLISAVCVTLRKRVIIQDEARPVLGNKQCILALWHNRVFAPCYMYRHMVKSSLPICLLTSASKDGALLATVAALYGFRAVRGSSHRRGAAGFRDMLREVQDGSSMCITPDGPKGPIYKCRAGVVRLASASGLPILPACVDLANCWRIARAWDGFAIPKPFSRVTIMVKAPIYVPRNLDDDTQAACLEQLELAMACGRPDFEPLDK